MIVGGIIVVTILMVIANAVWVAMSCVPIRDNFPYNPIGPKEECLGLKDVVVGSLVVYALPLSVGAVFLALGLKSVSIISLKVSRLK